MADITTVEDLARQADAIVKGRCKKAEMVVVPTSLDEQTIMTAYEVAVTETLKDDGHLPKNGVVVSVVVGGSRRNGVLVPPVGTLTPGLKRNDEVVLFLRWWPGLGGYLIHGDATGAFKIENSEVVPYREGSQVADRLLNRSAHSFLSEMKSAAKAPSKP